MLPALTQPWHSWGARILKREEKEAAQRQTVLLLVPPKLRQQERGSLLQFHATDQPEEQRRK